MLAQIAIVAVPLLVAVVFHEVAHGVVAYACGDPTAARAGRLTLNPLPHVDPVGTVLLPGILLLTSLAMGTRRGTRPGVSSAACVAPLRIASAKPCQLVAPDAVKWNSPEVNRPSARSRTAATMVAVVARAIWAADVGAPT